MNASRSGRGPRPRSTTDLPNKLVQEIEGIDNAHEHVAETGDLSRFVTSKRRGKSRKELRATKKQEKKMRKQAHALRKRDNALASKRQALATKQQQQQGHGEEQKQEHDSKTHKKRTRIDAEKEQKKSRKKPKYVPAPWEQQQDNALDAEIAYLEAKLGSGSAASKKLQHELESDGLMELHNVADNLDQPSDNEEEEQEDQEGDDYEDEIVSLDSDGTGSNEEHDDEEDEEDEEDDERERERREILREKSEIRKRKQVHLYGSREAVDGGGETGGRYVPPHQRAAQLGRESSADVRAQRARLHRLVRGLFNRVSESNIEPISRELQGLFVKNARGDLTQVLSDVMLSACCSDDGDRNMASSVLTAYAAILVCLNVGVGREVGAVVLERVALAFEQQYKASQLKAAVNLLLLLSNLYSFQMLHSCLVYDLLQRFIERFEPLDIELILVLVENCGYQLRRDDPSKLRDLIVLVQSKASKYTNPELQQQTETETEVPVGRVQFMLDAIYDLKNNRQRLTDANERLAPLRKWLRQRCSATSNGSVDRQLRVTWRDLIDADVYGRWWMVGSAWRGRTDADSSKTSTGANDDVKGDSLQSELDGGSAQLLSLARQRRMSSDVRRAIFCVVMGADDFMHAFERLVRLDLRSPHDRDVAFVLLDCCGAERLYNAYYALLAAQLCRFQRAYKFTFTLLLWDVYKRFDDATPRRTCNLARLAAHLVAEFVLSLAHLKNVEFERLEGAGLLFFNVFFKTLFTKPMKSIGAMFERISAKSDLLALRNGIAFFLQQHFLPAMRRRKAAPDLAKHVGLAISCMERSKLLETL